MDIQGLKDKILELAIQGKLVEQDPNDESASVLLEKIKEEKDRLVEEKKTKREKVLPEITEEEKLFVIPKSWEWAKLGNIVSILGDGLHGTPIYSEKGKYSFINGNNLNDGKIVLKEHTKRVDYIEYEKYKKELNERTVLISINGTVGNIGFYNNENIVLGKSACYFNLINIIDKKYIKNILESSYFSKYTQNSCTGTTIKNLSLKSMNNLVLPIPPLEEQKRIVKRIDELFSLLNQLSSNKKDLLTTIELTRNQVLQEAIKGKLVEQNSEDEPASVLLEKIKREKELLIEQKKLKKTKPLAEITEEEKPFDIPESWEWTILGEVAQFINGDRGKNYPSKSHFIEEGIPFINAGHLKASEIDVNMMNYITEKKFESLNSGKVKKNDIIYCLRGTLGKCSINKGIAKGAIASSLVIIRNYENIDERYLYYYLNSSLSKDMISKYDNGTAQPNLSSQSVRQYLLPLPPFEEQKRIVEKVNNIMNILDKFENQLIIQSQN